MANTKEKLCGAPAANPDAGHLCVCSLADWHPAAAAHFSAPGMESHACDCGESWKVPGLTKRKTWTWFQAHPGATVDNGHLNYILSHKRGGSRW